MSIVFCIIMYRKVRETSKTAWDSNHARKEGAAYEKRHVVTHAVRSKKTRKESEEKYR